MFGYVRIRKSELLVREADEYKAVYCSLCRAMGKEYGFFTRFILSYDSTFYAMLILGLCNEEPSYRRGRCRCNPLKRCVYAADQNAALKKAAAFSVISAYYKILDEAYDSGFFKRLLWISVRPYYFFKRKKAVKNGYGYMDRLLADMSKNQQSAEKDEKACLDMYCDPTAKMLALLFEEEGGDSAQKKVLHTLGYYLGRWIYLADAADDFEKDMKEKGFNPFLKLGYTSKKEMSPFAEGLLNLCLSEIPAAYDLLNIKKYNSILENILTLGLKGAQAQALEEKKQKGKNNG